MRFKIGKSARPLPALVSIPYHRAFAPETELGFPLGPNISFSTLLTARRGSSRIACKQISRV